MRSSRINSSLTTEFALVQENILLQNEKITQLYVIQSAQNPFLWFGVLFVDQGIFMGYIIRFTIFIEETYPDCSCPKVVFNPIPPHPLVNPFTGELDTKNAFLDWNSNTRHLYELLLFVKRVIRQADEYIDLIGNLLNTSKQQTGTVSNNSEQMQREPLAESQQILLSTSSPQNHPTINNPLTANYHDGHHDSSITSLFTWFHHTIEFLRVYNIDRDEFQKRLEEFRDKCNQQLLDRPALCGDDSNAIVFSPWNPEIHEPLRKCVLAGRFTPTSLFATYHKETESVAFIPGHDNTEDS